MFYPTNYLSVLGAALAAFLLGWIWYGPLFGKQWMAMMGYTKESIKTMKMKPSTAMVLGFFSMLAMAYVVAMFSNILAIADFSGAVALAFFLWLGFVATVLLGSVLWENRSWNLYFFNIAYHLVTISLIAVIVSLWS